MLSMIAGPILTLALMQGSATPPCQTSAESFPPPGCEVLYEQGICFLKCDSFPYFRTCDGD